VPFFAPIVRELENGGHDLFVTTRDCFQVRELAELHQLQHRCVGTHYGANKALKVLGTLWRALQLAPLIARERPDISLSHGSRPLVLLSALLRIPTVYMFDYEFARSLPLVKPTLGIAPDVISDRGLASQFRRGLCGYSGLKEDVYAGSFHPDPSLLDELQLSSSDIIATIRPPAVEAHYHNPESEALFTEVIEFLGRTPGVRMVIVPRNEKREKDAFRRRWPQWCSERRIIIPDRVVGGLNLIWHSDLVVSGGGTMNREAAALRVPVYSIFRGRIGAVDAYLANQGRLTLISRVEEISTTIRPIKRDKSRSVPQENRPLTQIMAGIESVLSAPCSSQS